MILNYSTECLSQWSWSTTCESVLAASIRWRLAFLEAIRIMRPHALYALHQSVFGLRPRFYRVKIVMGFKISKLMRQIGSVLISLIVIYWVASSREGFDDYLNSLKAARGYPVPSKPMSDRSIQESTYLYSQTVCPDGTRKSEHVGNDCAQDLAKPYTYIPNLRLMNPFRATQLAEGQQCYFNKDCYSDNCYNYRCLPPRA